MSVISTLRDRATTTPSDEAFVFMDYDTKTGDQIDRMTWSQLYYRVTAVSAYLISYGRHADRRRTAAISAPQGLDYVAGFLGALCAGWTPVPLPEPLGSLRDKRTGLAVLDCAADVVLTTSQAETRVRATIATHGASVTTPVIALDTLDEPSGDNCDLDSQLSDWSSYLQYTSGSTANPVVWFYPCVTLRKMSTKLSVTIFAMRAARRGCPARSFRGCRFTMTWV